jgi:glycosyltransferase involved in cell wall biosynthesis
VPDSDSKSYTVSVIIPAFNAARCIARAVQSVLDQTYCDYQIIVIDDGSTDNTAQIVKAFGDKVTYLYQPNAGVSAARNTAISAAKGSWIAFLDADDQWLKDKLTLQMALLGKYPFLKWCASNRYQSDGIRKSAVADPAVLKQALGDKDYFENYFHAAAQNKCPIITSSIIVAKEVFDQVGSFQPGLVMGEDLDLWWRITYRYPQIGYIPQPLNINFLDVANVDFTRLRLETKRGISGRNLIARHIELAVQQNMLEDFHPLAAKLLKGILLTAIYHGYRSDARITVKQFGEFFPWYWRLAAYVLTIFPKLTSLSAKTAAFISYKLNFDKNVSRRWLHKKTLKDNK